MDTIKIMMCIVKHWQQNLLLTEEEDCTNTRSRLSYSSRASRVCKIPTWIYFNTRRCTNIWNVPHSSSGGMQVELPIHVEYILEMIQDRTMNDWNSGATYSTGDLNRNIVIKNLLQSNEFAHSVVFKLDCAMVDFRDTCFS